MPPAGEGWVQTTTIEGTPTIDAWVKAVGPRFLDEFGVFFWHSFFGFTKAQLIPPSAEGTGIITGQAVYLHENRPPGARGTLPSRPIKKAWIGLNNLGGQDEMIYAQRAGEDGSFTIENVAPGMYQLVVWDLDLDAIIGFRTVTIPAVGGVVDMGLVSTFAWFGFYEGSVFLDTNGDGVRDPGEAGIPLQQLNIRFPDGSFYATRPTDLMGNFFFEEVFPFFRWLVLEVDFARYKATGSMIVVDDGGPVAPGEVLNPQPQPENGGLGWRVDTDSLLTHAMLLYAGQTNQVYWGKQPYAPGENGGITGIVFYATTRAEADPRFAAVEAWEVGIPRVQVNLYMDADADQVIDDLNGDGRPTLADVDNYPFGWKDGGPKGPEDIDRNRSRRFDPGDAIMISTTDSWDDNLPDAVGDPQFVRGVQVTPGAETIRTWNQIRPGVFDGGYAFESYVSGGMASGNPEQDGLPAGYYIVEAVPPPGYEILKEEDKNVDFGDSYTPGGGPTSPGIIAVQAAVPQPPPDPLAPPIPVGDPHLVPDELTLFPGIEAPYAGEWRPLADRKQVFLADGENAAADFFLFTEVPKAGRIWGMVLSDLLYEFDPNSPMFGLNFAPSWLPVAIKDFKGNEITRVYTDEWGKYSSLVPATYTVNVPSPTGVSPSMLTAWVNDPGPIPDPKNPRRMIPGLGFNQLFLSPNEINIAMKALASDSRTKVLAAPRILVNDNATGTLASISEAPYTSINASDTVATTSFAGYASAGITVTVTPHISEGDHLQLKYSITLNSFSSSEEATVGIPPPRQTDTITSDVTVPNGYAVVVGGLKRKDTVRSVLKVPFLGDLPGLKHLFRLVDDKDIEGTLFVFIRPIILRDDKFEDLKYLSEGDLELAGLPPNLPPAEPMIIR